MAHFPDQPSHSFPHQQDTRHLDSPAYGADGSPEQEQTERQQIIEEVTRQYQPFDSVAEFQQLRVFEAADSQSGQDPRTRVHDRIAEFRIQLHRQQWTIGGLKNQLYDQVHEQPDISRAALWGIVAARAGQGRLTERQLEHFYVALERYERNHAVVEEFAGQELSPDVQYETVFGFAPEGEVAVDKGPMTLTLSCQKPVDFAAAYTGRYPDDLTAEEVASLDSIGAAFVSHHVIEPDLAGVVIIENAGTPNWQNHPTALAAFREHEEWHAIYYSLEPVEETLTLDDVVARAVEANLPAEALVKNLARARRMSDLDEPARDEIIALTLDGSSIGDIYDHGTLATGERYRSERPMLIQEMPKTIAAYQELAQKLLGAPDWEPLPLDAITDIVSDVFQEEYENDGKLWTTAIYDLDAKGYSRREIVGYLLQWPMQKWYSNAIHLPARNELAAVVAPPVETDATPPHRQRFWKRLGL